MLNQTAGHRYLNMNVEMDLRALVPPGQKPSRGNYCVACPLCREHLHKENCFKLYIKDDFESGICFRCGSKFHAPRPDPNSGLWKSRFNKGMPEFEEFTDESIDCDYYNKSEIFDVKGLEYLENRWKFLSDNYIKLGFKFRPNSVVIPFRKNGNGEIYFYQCRSTDPNSKQRYFIPPSKNKPIYIAPNSELTSKKVIISEGIFGSIAIGQAYKGYKSIAVLGSTVTNYQLYQLGKMDIQEIVLYFDDPVINSSVMDIVKRKFPFSMFSQLTSPLGDPQDDYLNNVSPPLSVANKLSFSDKFKINLENVLGKY